MEQLHKRFTAEQVKTLLKGFCLGTLDRPAIEEILSISKSGFFALLKEYRQDPDKFSLASERSSPARLPPFVEKEIEKEVPMEFRCVTTLTRCEYSALFKGEIACGESPDASGQTDDVDPQWRQVMRTVRVDVTFALSPQAKGKVERPYRWLQDRIVRTCAIEKIAVIDDARSVLKAELQQPPGPFCHRRDTSHAL